MWSKECYLKVFTFGIIMFLTAGFFYMSAGLMGRGNDVAWHTLNGIQMIQSHHIIHTDVLTWKTFGHAWSNPEWLFDVLVGATYLKFGWFGIRLLVVLFGELLMIVLVSYAIPRQKRSTIIIFSIIVAFNLVPYYTARPQIVSFVMFALSIYLIEIARRDGWGKLLWFIPAFIFWNNAHGSAILFLGLLGLEWFEDHKVWPYIMGFVLLLAVRLGNPFELVHFVYGQLSPVTLSISEFRSPDFHSPQALLMLSYFAVSCLLVISKTSPREKAWLILGWLAYFISIRFGAYAAFLTWFIVMKHLDLKPLRFNVMPILATFLVVLFICKSLLFWRSPFYEPIESGAAQYCVQHGIKDVVNEYGIGGVLEWYGLKTIADGRGLWVGEKWFSVSVYFDTESGKYPMKKFLEEEAPSIKAVIWLDNTPVALQMNLLQEWNKVYDNASVSVWTKS
ncbi:MAG: hypothetical protein P4L49_00810 [Desulfosporosinus sp.]|nr:hypothetical protein [Desulfosporosinus sp.]